LPEAVAVGVSPKDWQALSYSKRDGSNAAAIVGASRNTLLAVTFHGHNCSTSLKSFFTSDATESIFFEAGQAFEEDTFTDAPSL
jgi:hypothetical protein